MSVAGVARRRNRRAFGIAEAEVRVALRETVDNFRNGEHLREIWALEDIRLHRLGLKFFHKAMVGEGDCQAAMTYVKISERRATLAGANSPIGHTVTVMHQAAPPELTSTQLIDNAIDDILHIGTRERFLLDKESEIGGPGITLEEAAEIDELRKVRGRGLATRT